VIGAFLLQTPLTVVSGSMVLASAMAVRSGVEIVGRFAELFLPAFITLFLLIIFPIIPDLHLSNMLPIMGEGMMPSLMGAFVLQAWFSELITASFFLPFVADQKKVTKSILIVLLMIVLTLIVSNLATLLLLGNVTGSYTYPFLILARYINLFEFFTHLEAIFMAIWVLGAFVKICVFFYVAVLGAAQWLKLSDYRPIVFPFGFLLTLISMWVAPNLQKLNDAISKSVSFAVLTMFVAVPVLLLCLAWGKRRLWGIAAKK
jgi:spore germination protein KB